MSNILLFQLFQSQWISFWKNQDALLPYISTY